MLTNPNRQSAFLVVALFALLFLLNISIACEFRYQPQDAPNKNSTIAEGIVVDSSGKAIEGAKVFLIQFPNYGDRLNAMTTTDVA